MKLKCYLYTAKITEMALTEFMISIFGFVLKIKSQNKGNKWHIHDLGDNVLHFEGEQILT